MERKRLTASERRDAQKLAVCKAILEKGFDTLDARINGIKDAKRDLALCRTLIAKTLEATKKTLLPEQEETFNHSLAEVTYEIMARCPATAHNDAQWMKENGMWLSGETINNLVDGCIQGCVMCGYDTLGQMKCPTRKAMNVIPRDFGPDDDGKGKCPFYGLNI